MSITYVNAALRRLVESRADGICEYCLIAAADTILGCQVDHVISEKHSGSTTEENLAMACVYCNQGKGSDIGSISWTTGEFVRLFNPRKDHWSEHFRLIDYRIDAQTEIGAVTARILQFNVVERLLERQVLALAGRYPCEAAQRRMENAT
jgi:hypothetical protein